MTAVDQPTKTQRRPFFWEQEHTSGVPDGKDLAALRSGLGREAGEVPRMWPYYTTLRPDGQVDDRLRAEHAALCLFALHQQAQTILMHTPGVGVGTAMAKLRLAGKFTAEAVDRRFAAAATATSFTEVVAHLRGLVTQLRSLVQPQPLDYTQLFRDLCAWQNPDRVVAVRRRWGSQYFTASDSDRADESRN